MSAPFTVKLQLFARVDHWFFDWLEKTPVPVRDGRLLLRDEAFIIFMARCALNARIVK